MNQDRWLMLWTIGLLMSLIYLISVKMRAVWRTESDWLECMPDIFVYIFYIYISDTTSCTREACAKEERAHFWRIWRTRAKNKRIWRTRARNKRIWHTRESAFGMHQERAHLAHTRNVRIWRTRGAWWLTRGAWAFTWCALNITTRGPLFPTQGVIF